MRRVALRQLASSASRLMEKLNRYASSRSNYAADRCSLMAQPAWRQLQESSMVAPASSQYWLQYFLSFPTRQLHAGCSHFFNSSCMRRPPLIWGFPFRFSGSLNSLTTSIGAYHVPLLMCGVRPMAPPSRPDECQGSGSLRSVSEAIRRRTRQVSGGSGCAESLLILGLEGSRYDRSTSWIFKGAGYPCAAGRK
jgi:hypothetical protein